MVLLSSLEVTALGTLGGYWLMMLLWFGRAGWRRWPTAQAALAPVAYARIWSRIEDARRKILKGQAPFLDQLEKLPDRRQFA